jgi:Domain of unknown function (DUF4169)
MADILNLRRARKARDKAAAGEIAARNRAVYGQSRAERLELAAGKRSAEQRLDGHKLGTDPDDTGKT